ncbi:hypothetical protein EJG51_012955 [Undibacterium piscinae]|uniref:Aspartate kinase n=1 Tax=Undibacterium piscinae TaxID=2495591 RepID=A0A6M4A7A3_9BURK|nr:hypothetical protein EJG51_012955 [Undibacterium piscinae]
MKKIVVKFGGSNLRRPQDIDRIVNVVQTYNRPSGAGRVCVLRHYQ